MMSQSLANKTIYSPDSQLRQPGFMLRQMVWDLFNARELAWRLFIRNISAQYRQSILGYLWAFLPPLLSMLVWTFLNRQKVINIPSTGMPYPVFVLTGTILWQTFVDAMNSPMRIVNQSKDMLAKINFPREALLLAGVGEVLFNFLIRCILLIAVFIWFELSMPWTLPLALLGAVALIAMGLTIGVILTPLAALYGDVEKSLLIIVQFCFFLTPIIYPMPTAGFAKTLALMNPLTPVILAIRDLMVVGQTAHLQNFFIVAGTSVLLLFFGWIFYRLSIPHLIARMSS